MRKISFALAAVVVVAIAAAAGLRRDEMRLAALQDEMISLQKQNSQLVVDAQVARGKASTAQEKASGLATRVAALESQLDAVRSERQANSQTTFFQSDYDNTRQSYLLITPTPLSPALHPLVVHLHSMGNGPDEIGTKLTIGFGILVALTILSAGVSYLGSGQATTKINLTDDVRVPAALAAARAQASLLQMQSDIRGYLALGDQEYRESFDKSTQSFESAIADLDRLAQNLDPENQRRLDGLKTNYQEWSGLPDRLFVLRNDQLEREPAYRILATDGVRLAGKVLIDTNSLIDAQGQREATPDNTARLADMAKFQGNFASMLSALRGYVTTRNRVFRQEYDVNLADNKIAWDRLTSKRSTLTPNQQKLLDSMAQNRDLFLKLPTQIFQVLESDRWRQDLYLFKTEALPRAEKMQQLLSEITSDQETVLKADLAAGRQNLDNTNRLILAGGVIALLMGIVMAFVSRENIAGPISRLTLVAERIRAGDLGARAVVESKDETGTLAETFNNMTAQLRQTLLQVRKEKNRADGLLEVVIPIGVELASEKNFN